MHTDPHWEIHVCTRAVVTVSPLRFSPGLTPKRTPFPIPTGTPSQSLQVVTEVERANDLIRSSMRALVAISKIEGASQSSKFAQVRGEAGVGLAFRVAVVRPRHMEVRPGAAVGHLSSDRVFGP